MEVEDLKAFQSVSTMDPGIERIIKERVTNDEYYRIRTKSFTKTALERVTSTATTEMRERSGSFSHLRSPKFQPKNPRVSELFNAVRDEKKCSTPLNVNKTLQNAQRSSGLCGDSPPNLSHFFEVLYLGKIKVSHKRAPPTFIDEAVKKMADRTDQQQKRSDTPSAEDQQDLINKHDTSKGRSMSAVHHPLADRSMSLCDVVGSVAVKPSADETQATWNNKVMLLQISRKDLRLISPDKKQVLIHKSFREISHCSCGQNSKLNFGFICKEISDKAESTSGYVGYIFQCDSSSVVEDIMQGLKSAFYNAHETARKEREEQQCSNCPMVWFNELCAELEGLPPNKAQSVLLRKVEGLGEKESSGILSKMQGAETPDISEQNQIMMMLLKASCEVKQQIHLHSGYLLSGNSAPTPVQTQENVLSEAAKKAKRSLAESFNGIIRRKTTTNLGQDNGDAAPLPPSISVERPTPIKMPYPFSLTNAERRLGFDTNSPDVPMIPVRSPLQPLTPDKHREFQCRASPELEGEGPGGGGRQRSKTVGSAGGEAMKRELARRRISRLGETLFEEEETRTSPQVSIFKKTGSRSPNCDVITSRQHIFNKVTTPGKTKLSKVVRHEPRNCRDLWQTAIKQQILLNRMEKENQKMQAHEEVLAMRRIKLDYEDLVNIPPEAVSQWDSLLAQGVRCKRSEIRHHIGQGVFKGKRGEIWSLVVAQSGEDTPPPTDEFDGKLSEWDRGYEELRSQLTPHQHAILIDLGRTFPTHVYFSGALGPGQLGMFNLLKSYSILDPEVGYCQGLPFLVGLLLMHLEEEEEAFNLLKFIMFNLNLRSMFKPDMTGLQVSMYQLTRLLSETQPALYKLLDKLEVDPSLYATPWFLTLFAANFPLGFVTRVVDLLVLDGKSAIIKVGMCLLVQASSSLLECDSLEEVMNIIKTELPGLPASSLEDVVKQAASLNVSRQLKTYEVEYLLLQEEMSLHQTGKGESYESLSQQNISLRRENTNLLEQISALEKRLEEEKNILEREKKTSSQLQIEKEEAERRERMERDKRLETEEEMKRILGLVMVRSDLPLQLSENVARIYAGKEINGNHVEEVENHVAENNDDNLQSNEFGV